MAMAERKAKRRPKVLRICRECGKEFFIHQSHVDQGGGIFCSRRCSGISNSKTRPPVVRKCKLCGKEFQTRKSRINDGRGVFCSKECSYKGRGRRKPEQRGSLVCKLCGKVFVGKTKRQVYCSGKCRSERSRTRGGTSRRRGPKSRRWVVAVIKRDKKCVRCGRTDKLQAHHIKHWKKHPELRLKLDNGVALCLWCHHAQHPTMPFEKFDVGGVSVQYCVVCEGPYVAHPENQRTCSRKCGGLLRRRKGEGTCQQS